MALVSLALTVFTVIRDPRVQTLGIRIAAAFFSREWNTDVRIGEFSFSLSNGVVLKEVLVRDQRDTVMFATRELAVRPDFKQLWNGNLHIRKVLIDGGEFQLITHQGDSLLNLQFIIDYFASADTVPESPDTTPSKPFSISGAFLEIRHFRFHLQDCNEVPVEDGMDYANIDVRDINLKISNFNIRGDTIAANITSLMAKERSGIELLSFSGEASVCSHHVRVRNLKILTNRSDLDLDFAMLYNGYASFLDFINEVTIKGDIRPSVFNLADVGYFAPEVKVMDNLIKLEGELQGTVSRFRAENMKIALGEGTRFQGDISAAGLPDVYKTYADIDIREFVSSKRDIERFRIPAEPDTIALPSIIASLGQFGLKGRFTGYWDDFTADFQVATDLGNASGKLSLGRDPGTRIFTYSGDVSTTSLDLGGLLKDPASFGNVTLRGAVSGSGITLADADLRMNLQVDTIGIYGYDYQKIAINGSLAAKEFNGSVSVRDPNVWLDFNGLADFHDSLPAFDFNAMIHRAQLFNIHLLERDSVQNISGEILARFSGNSLDNLEGMLRLDNFIYQEGEKKADVSELLLKTSRDPKGSKTLHVESDYVDADITGIYSFANMVGSIENFINNYIASFTLNDSAIVRVAAPVQVVQFIIEIKDAKEVTDIFLPFLVVAPGAYLSGYFDTEKELIRIDGHAPLVTVSGMDVTNLEFGAESDIGEVRLTAGCDHFFLSRSNTSDTLDIRVDSLNIDAFMRRDSILYDVRWMTSFGKSLLAGFLTFPEEGTVHIKQTDLDVAIRNIRWKIDPGNLVVIDSTGYEFRSMDLQSISEGLSVNGRMSDDPKDTLYLRFRNLNISNADYLIGNSDINIDGILSGTLKLRDVFHDFTFYSDLRVDKLYFNQEPLGDALLGVNYDRSNNRFDIHASIIYTGNIGQNIPLSVDGEYRLGDHPDFDFDIKLKNLNLKMVEPFVSDFMSKVSGLVSGEAHLSGTPEKPVLKGKLKLMRTEFRISYLDVPYSLSDEVSIEPDKILFDKVTLYDSLGNKAYLNGAITHSSFKDIRLDLHLSMNDFSAFHNTPAQNTVFYGKARASGNVSITGPVDNISIDVKASTGSKTHVVIPINLTADVGQMDYIIFEEKFSDTLTGVPVRVPKPNPAGISIFLDIAVKQDADVEVFLPDQLGNLKASGNGDLTMTMTPTTPFLLNGSYVISKGSFLLQLRNLLRLPFSISEGSRITWTGDPANADIGLSASYRTKVPLQGLTTDPQVASTRVTVDCILRLKGKLLNPTYEFGLTIVNAEDAVKNLVYNTIDTTNQVEMSQQVLSILMLNQFNPIVSSAGGMDVSGTSMSIVTNQINSMISRMTSNVNVNVNYQPGTAATGQEFDVGVSTQFLDDRLLIDGAFGMTSYMNTSSEQTNTIVGDINIEYILTKNRRWRVHAFNRTNTLDLLYNNAPYTQGVGFSYQRDFNTVREIFAREKKKGAAVNDKLD